MCYILPTPFPEPFQYPQPWNYPNEYIPVPSITTDRTDSELIKKLLKEATRKLTPEEIERQCESWIRSLGHKPRIRVKAKGERW